jgi:hypothetical protein
MLYLAIAVVAVGVLLFVYGRKRMRESELGGLTARMSKVEAQAEYNRCRAVIAARLGDAPPGEIERLSERGAWMMDRIRGLEGDQTGPVQRARHRLALVEAAEREARGEAPRTGDQ